MIAVNFYNYNGDSNVINKTLQNAVTINGVLRDASNVITPTITVRANSRPNYNYCHIPELGRYYFVNGVTVIDGERYSIALRVDVLKTYENLILTANGTITRKDNPNGYISNRETVFNRKPNYEIVNFPNSGLFTKDGTIIMVTLKGSK